MKNKPNKVTAELKVVVTGEFYDDEASEETLRYCIEQDLEDVGFDVEVELQKEREAVEPVNDPFDFLCGSCGRAIGFKYHFCQWCGKKVKWND